MSSSLAEPDLPSAVAELGHPPAGRPASSFFFTHPPSITIIFPLHSITTTSFNQPPPLPSQQIAQPPCQAAPQSSQARRAALYAQQPPVYCRPPHTAARHQ
ncbi:proline-rich receptor-like protein kinase PERK12 [Iris pallida]|uniref:Proline-rich receptor-like protein kinase PERK12 n=1 Tax=Iris pallida TaxID=29817 RepID=A0AAX6I9J8_IRIPA|nr:proline-rich receptor-like protein kinase PERK12 [Iris pallida]